MWISMWKTPYICSVFKPNIRLKALLICYIIIKEISALRQISLEIIFMDLIKEKWSDILEYVRKEHDVTDVAFETWLLPLKVYSTDNYTVKIIVPMGDQMITYLNSRFKTPLYVAVAEITGEKYEIEFITEKDAEDLTLSSLDKDSVSSDSFLYGGNDFERSTINARYTFDTFVVGNNNKFAHAASLAVAETPGKVYNPLFLYGGAGLGKTHLMHAVANYLLNISPEMKVLYVTTEYFTNELIETLRIGDPSGMTRFREKYRNIDVLLIDDVQFLIGKESTQEEFFHTFNALYNANKQLIISSDRPPKDIETLEERLRTRFECGLIADISSPDFETRVAILRKKEELDGYIIDDVIINYIAANIKSNVRELEGAFNRLIALSKIEKRPIDLELAEEAIKDIVSPGERRKVTSDLIIEVVAEHFKISPEDLKSNKRNASIAYPRQIVMYLCKENGATYKKIGEILGGRDHSTIMHGAEKIEKEVREEGEAAHVVNLIKKKLYPS